MQLIVLFVLGEQFGETFLSFKAGDELKIISSNTRWHGNPDDDGWIYAQTMASDDDHSRSLPRRGFIPTSFVDLQLFPEPVPLSSPRQSYNEGSYPMRHRGRGMELLTLGQATEL